MKSIALVSRYVVWHYSKGLADLARHWKHFNWFVYHFFSLPILFRTFFSPWKRMYEEKTEKFSIEHWFERTIINTLMRLFGMLCRTAIIFSGVLALALLNGAFFAFSIIWITLPLLVFGLVMKGISLLIGRT